jgi:glycosyltransferase involved in cell wall biosynthesis
VLKNLKITILTPSYNQGDFIEENIQSVMNQDYDNIEHIIIDGGSTDGTIEILKKYPHLKWVSEKDEGQSDALNKGFTMATGDIIGWINSDDYYEENIFKKVVDAFRSKKCNWLIGNSRDYYEQHNAFVHVISKPVTHNALINDVKMTRQPPTFFKKSLLDEVGFVRNEYHYVMDYELWLRLTIQSKPYMIEENFSVFRIHAEQKTSALNKFKSIKEQNHLLKREGVSWSKRQFVMAPQFRTLFKTTIKLILIKLNLIDKMYGNIPYSTRNLKL